MESKWIGINKDPLLYWAGESGVLVPVKQMYNVFRVRKKKKDTVVTFVVRINEGDPVSTVCREKTGRKTVPISARSPTASTTGSAGRNCSGVSRLKCPRKILTATGKSLETSSGRAVSFVYKNDTHTRKFSILIITHVY